MTTNNAEKIVTFRMGNELYGFNIAQVMSIEKMDDVTKLPDLPTHIKGILNLRGYVIPIIDLRHFMFKTSVDLDVNNRIIVARVDDTMVGLIVDEATEVMDIPNELVQSVSIAGTELTQYLKVAKLPDVLIMIIDIGQLIHKTDIAKALAEVKHIL